MMYSKQFWGAQWQDRRHSYGLMSFMMMTQPLPFQVSSEEHLVSAEVAKLTAVPDV
jgi:hypothetical protein